MGPCHVYAKPHGPNICPVLSLARYLFKDPELLVNKTLLLQWKPQYNRFFRMFLLLIKENLEQLKTLGVEEGNLGTYSCRKLFGTMDALCCTVSPKIVSTCIRSGWVMGGVKYQHLKRKSAGDQQVGSCESGPDQIEKTFAASPHTFIYLRSRTKSKNPGKRKDKILSRC